LLHGAGNGILTIARGKGRLQFSDRELRLTGLGWSAHRPASAKRPRARLN